MRKFEEIVDLVIEQIRDEKLKPGDRLLPHRQMAYEFQCSIGTASRAYAELERRGVIYGKVGQGTFVYGTETDQENVGKGSFFPRDVWIEKGSDFVDLSKNSYFHRDTDDRLRDVFTRLSKENEPSRYLDYFDSRGRPKDREIAAHWLRRFLVEPDPENIVITQGAQSGLYLSLATLASPGDIVATEAFGYPGIRAVAYELDLRLAPISMDEEGLVPEEFEQVCRRGNVKVLVTVPTNHNPTGATQSLARRLEIIEIAKAYHVHIVEDAVYAPLQHGEISNYGDLAPEDTVYLTSLSKAFSPGIRVGYLVAPSGLIPRLATKMTAIHWMTSPIALDMANFFLQGGQVEDQARALMDICLRREAMARTILKPWLKERREECRSPLAHLWIELPVSQSMTEFVSKARREHIVVVPGDSFAMAKTVVAHHIRICLMAEPDDRRLEKALKRLATILIEEHSPVMVT